ncbi:MAG: tRNA(5-methylaminomethyl-2-thiouridylate) methyltransferase [Desulfovibrionaceae bacterium]|nr:tRNA(5-methylaminomethyl-2-thiouridylate) methyltransferase [Desulfovibrionaceae bacterium]
MSKQYDGVGLFSGGLDGLLAIKLLEEQGLKIKALHFYSPFFGHPRNRAYWRRIYGIDVTMIDIGQEFVDMLSAGPVYGVGKMLNPCVDCKILLLEAARRLMPKYGASFLVTGEVVGQRPMSQRRDTLNIISRDAAIRDVLLRPLSALCLNPTAVEESGLVDRSRLLGIWGRGRKEQFELAKKYGIEVIPTPAGGCLLTEKENARRFWPIFKYLDRPAQSHFWLANVGRQFWSGAFWLSVGRHERDNARLNELLLPGDILLRLTGYPGPLALARNLGAEPWPQALVEAAASLLASFSPKAVAAGEPVETLVRTVGENESENCIMVLPNRNTLWGEAAWEETAMEIKQRYKS